MKIQKGDNKDLNKLIIDHQERLKELSAINQTTKIIREGLPIDETLQKIALILPKAWQYTDYSTARIIYNNKEYCSSVFMETKWRQAAMFETIDKKKGLIEVFYTVEFEEIDEGPFLNEERHLIDNLANIITGFLNSYWVRESTKERNSNELQNKIIDDSADLKTNRQLLQKFLNKNNYDRDIYHDLMPFKVKEILLVANLYDAYSIEKEGRFSEHVLGDYHTLNLTSLPRITGVSTSDEAFQQLRTKYFDLIIIMMGVDKKMPYNLSKAIRNEFPYIPIFTLLNNNQDISIVEKTENTLKSADRIFVWNGDSKVFFAMIKLVEDMTNVENDTRIGMVRVILLVEDSPKYYSRYLPILYKVVLEQTRRVIEDVTSDELYKVLKLRARPKILLASTWEEAIKIYDKYKEFLLCIISDVEFKKNGKMLCDAGIQLLEYIRNEKKELPAILQSSNKNNIENAYRLKATFIDKNSENMMQDFQSFISHYLGFGNFVYRDSEGNQIAIAQTLKDFEKYLFTIPDDSLLYHGKRNHFSLWLMARGEIQVARIINPIKVSDFTDTSELRNYLIKVVQSFRNEQNMGKVIPFEETAISDERNILALVPGSLGGKGRGLAFLNTLIYNFDFQKLTPEIKIRTPLTYIIGAEEFEYFIDRNNLRNKIYIQEDYQVVKKLFLTGSLSDSLIKKIRLVLQATQKPLAVRSSGLFEDSLTQPFAGIFETYLLPNNHPNIHIRLVQVMDAIKLVFASIFSNTARDYIKAINYHLEEERMAVAIQEVVGNQFDNVFYPHISGVANSYNYYPFAYMKPEDGFAMLAVGLGKYVVDGEKAFRFSPQYPDLEINSPKDQFKNSQIHFYAVNLAINNPNLLSGEDAGLKKLEIIEAERHGTLSHCASVYNFDNDIITPGLDSIGPRVINFADILKYKYIPLAETINTVLEIGKEALGSPIEIEYAIDLKKDSNDNASFYLLQIKPLIGNMQEYNVNLNEIKQEDILLVTNKGMGNGVIENLHDVVFVKNENFNKSKTEDMVVELEKINQLLTSDNIKYILIGPGRWGSRDKWIGIPVTWPQISNAKVIVETNFENFPLDASSGSHFFHNVTSMNVGYLSIQQGLDNQRINWKILFQQPVIHESKYFLHIRFKKPLLIRMDGKKGISVITFQND